MKTSKAVFVLGLSAALSAPQAFAEFDFQVYPGDTCVKLSGGANITRNQFGGIRNDSQSNIVFVSCPVDNNVLRPITDSFVQTTDRNPDPIISDQIICNLLQVMRTLADSNIVFRMTGTRTSGASNNLQTLRIGPPDPAGVTGSASANFFTCIIPRQTSDGASSELHSYAVIEGVFEPSGGVLFPLMLPPDAQERQARAAVEAQEMRVTQALKTEKEDPEWSQRAETSWTQAFQQEVVKEELKGIQLRNIECRTTLCRVELTPTAPPQGDAVFGQDFTKLTLLAPWPVQGFGKIENPDGRAPVAVLYIAREGYSLP